MWYNSDVMHRHLIGLYFNILQALYERLFRFIVGRVNKAVAVDLPEGTPTTVISVLDIYGFEVLETNR